MHGTEQDLSGFFGGYYLALAVMNGVAALYLWHWLHRVREAVIWSLVALGFVALGAAAQSGSPFPDWPWWGGLTTAWTALKASIDALTGPVIYSAGTTGILVVLFVGRRFFVKPTVAWTGLNLSLFAMGAAMTDANFAAIVTKADNVPIVGLVYLLAYFTWLATAKAVENDDRIANGLPPKEKLGDEKVLVWPDLVYVELICMIALTVFLLVWAIGIQAPLEEPASFVKTPNPSKAPWYFLGLQEMLVYFDPWMAGVVLPSLVVFGLMAIPYLDFNKKGNGYYTIAERKFSYIIFQIGFLELWITLIILGTFFRGPNWNIFGPFEFWDSHKVLALNNVDLSQIVWEKFIGVGMPTAPAGSGVMTKIGYIIQRECVGIVLVLAYLVALPPLLATNTKLFRQMFLKMGFVRYMIMLNLLLFMASLPIKMVCRWVWNLKYIVAIPEYLINI